MDACTGASWAQEELPKALHQRPSRGQVSMLCMPANPQPRRCRHPPVPAARANTAHCVAVPVTRSRLHAALLPQAGGLRHKERFRYKLFTHRVRQGRAWRGLAQLAALCARVLGLGFKVPALQALCWGALPHGRPGCPVQACRRTRLITHHPSLQQGSVTVLLSCVTAGGHSARLPAPILQ